MLRTGGSAVLSPTVKILATVWFGADVRMRVWGKLATQIRNRMTLEESLQRLREQAVESRSPLADIYTHIIGTVGQGRTLGDALAGLAGQEEIMLIASAQTSARLAEGLTLAARVLKARGFIRKSLLSSLTGPCMYFAACIAMLAMISVQVMPQLVMVSDPSSWTGASYLLYALSEFVGSWAGALTGICSLAALVAICLSFPLWTGQLRRLADRCIPWSIYRLTVGTVWLYTIATRMQAGHQLSQILENMVKQKSSPYLREIVTAILRHSRHGEDFGSALQASGMDFPSREIVDDLRVYARMPGFQAHIMEIADTWITEGAERVAGYARVIGVVVQLLVLAQLVLVAIVGTTFQDQIQTGGF